MGTLFKDGVVVEDGWISIDGDQPIPEGEDVVVSLTYFEEHAHALLTRNSGRLGVFLEAGDDVGAIAEHLDKVDLVSLDFPSFADGRAFSKARWLRDQYGYGGEVRAVGDVRIDQVNHMRRCGCDTLLVSHEATINALKEGRDPALVQYYQPAAGDDSSGSLPGRAWARRSF